MGYTPEPDTKLMLDRAMEHVNSVPYKVTARWVFYRLIQEGIFNLKDDYKNKYMSKLSAARKRCYGDWKPDSLSDDTREIKKYGWGAMDESEVTIDEAVVLDKFKDQKYFVIICFEAQAMMQQFEHYTDGIPLCPFKGQASIPYKWEIAKFLEEAKKKYDGKPIKILYFGDCDKWGKIIPEAAFKDISAWCNVDYELNRVGLTLEQAKEFNLPENPDKPNTYQWEALSDKQAKELITGAVGKYQDMSILEATVKREQELIQAFKDKLGS